MNLENLLNAAVELEKRIATDQMLRKYFSSVWGHSPSRATASKPAPATPNEAGKSKELCFSFPVEMCEWLDVASSATGKTPTQLLEESFAEYCARNVEKWKIST
jgi:hypothetical protein